MPTVTQSQSSSRHPIFTSSFYLHPTNPGEVSQYINKLKLTSTDLNTMPVRIFKLLSCILTHPLSSLINFSMVSGIFPNVLKEARLTPYLRKLTEQTHPIIGPLPVYIILVKFLSELFIFGLPVTAIILPY